MFCYLLGDTTLWQIKKRYPFFETPSIQSASRISAQLKCSRNDEWLWTLYELLKSRGEISLRDAPRIRLLHALVEAVWMRIWSMTCCGNTTDRSMFYPSQTSLPPIHGPWRVERLDWPGRETRTKNLESTARDSWRLLRRLYHASLGSY